jgi:hypothetical protein
LEIFREEKNRKAITFTVWICQVDFFPVKNRSSSRNSYLQAVDLFQSNAKKLDLALAVLALTKKSTLSTFQRQEYEGNYGKLE